MRIFYCFSFEIVNKLIFYLRSGMSCGHAHNIYMYCSAFTDYTGDCAVEQRFIRGLALGYWSDNSHLACIESTVRCTGMYIDYVVLDFMCTVSGFR